MRSIGLGVAVVVALLLTVAVAAQTGAGRLAQPLLVDVLQDVPTEVTLLVPLDGGEMVTVTTPLTVHVALQVSIDGAQVAAVKPLPAEAPAVTVATATPTPADNDNPGTPFLLVESGEAVTVGNAGVVLTISSVKLFDWQAMLTSDDPDIVDFVESALYQYEEMDSDQLLGTIAVEIENDTGASVGVHVAYDGTVLINREQIDLVDYRWISDEPESEILNGASVSGTMIFGVKQSSPTDVADGVDLRLVVSAPSNTDGETLAGAEAIDLTIRLE